MAAPYPPTIQNDAAASNRPPVSPARRSANPDDHRLATLRALAADSPGWVAQHAVSLSGRRVDPEGHRMKILVNALKTHRRHLIRFCTKLATEGPYRLFMMVEILRREVQDVGLRSACLVPWLNN